MCNYHTIQAKVKKLILLTFAVFSLIILSKNEVHSQEGKDIFAVCAACHTIDGGKLIGPDLQGVSERHDEAWLIKFIQNSQVMVQAGDETAVSLFEEYNKIPMPPNNLTDDQVRTLLKYIENYSKEATSETKTEPKADEVTIHESLYQIEPDYLIKAESRNYGTIC